MDVVLTAQRFQLARNGSESSRFTALVYSMLIQSLSSETSAVPQGSEDTGHEHEKETVESVYILHSSAAAADGKNIAEWVERVQSGLNQLARQLSQTCLSSM
jgi:hypothetical protein